MFFEEILTIGKFVLESLLHIWPYLLVTIPLAVAVQMSGASKYIKRAFEAKPFSAIVLATIVGAFSPFCSCSVIPVIASLLISGVPLGPVMSFWIASPSMDPEIFFLSVGMIGWELAGWRLVATLILSLGAGLLTHVVMQEGWLGQSILRTRQAVSVQSTSELLKKGWNRLKTGVCDLRPTKYPNASVGSDAESVILSIPVLQTANVLKASAAGEVHCQTCSSGADRGIPTSVNQGMVAREECYSRRPAESNRSGCPTSFKSRLVKETLSATWMVGKFMALAFLLEGLITLYVPAGWISASLGRQSPSAILAAALLGVPAYTTSLTALPMIGGLLNQGMDPAAALAFLIAGPTTTLPAMAAVWRLVSRRVFVLYVSFSLVGAILAGYAYSLIAWLR